MYCEIVHAHFSLFIIFMFSSLTLWMFILVWVSSSSAMFMIRSFSFLLPFLIEFKLAKFHLPNPYIFPFFDMFIIHIFSFLWHIHAGQFRNQTAITKKGTKLHVHMVMHFICCSLDLFRLLCHRFQISIKWNGFQLLLQWCPLPTLLLE